MNQKISQLVQALQDGGLLKATSKSPSVHPFIAIFKDGDLDQVSQEFHQQMQMEGEWEKTYGVLSTNGDLIIRATPNIELLFLPGLLKQFLKLNSNTIQISYANMVQVTVDVISKSIEIRGNSIIEVTNAFKAIFLANGIDVHFHAIPQSFTFVQAIENAN